jgi:potassium/hydrogen antiporter
MGMGILFGYDGIVGIYFDDYMLVANMASFALIFIMFYGGFAVKIEPIKPVAVQSVLMSSFGTIITALATGFFCYIILDVTFLEGLLIGSVVAATDAASVFSILYSHKLNLKDGLAPIIEVESGSNDPFAYMMTISILLMLSGESDISMIELVIRQLFFGILVGVGISLISIFTIRKIAAKAVDNLYPIALITIPILGYSVSGVLGGNGFLTVYIIGIMLGNSKISNKVQLVHFFDTISWFMQMSLFFILGLLAFPSRLGDVLVPSLLISLFLLLVARPIATFSILSWFKMPFKHQLFVSWVGLRGASSIVFAIFVVAEYEHFPYDIFHIVFTIAIFSIMIQGTLIPFIAKKLDLLETDPDKSIFKTFNDYSEEVDVKLSEYTLYKNHHWVGQRIIDSNLPDKMTIVMIKRSDKIVIPNGSTIFKQGDILVLNGDYFNELNGYKTTDSI